jgi:hypothetical protein
MARVCAYLVEGIVDEFKDDVAPHKPTKDGGGDKDGQDETRGEDKER